MKGLGLGGDDYITRPFGIGELRTRVAAHLNVLNDRTNLCLPFVPWCGILIN